MSACRRCCFALLVLSLTVLPASAAEVDKYLLDDTDALLTLNFRNVIDSSLFKNFRIRERVGLQFRAEFFNLPNRTNLGLPLITTFTSSGAVSPSAGLINYTTTNSRQIQLGLKMVW